MLVSRKNLSLIHFVPAEAAASGDVAKSSHEGVYFLPIARLGSELQQPFSKCRVERPPLGTGHLTGLFNEVFVGTEGDVLHTKSVYTKTVLPGHQEFPIPHAIGLFGLYVLNKSFTACHITWSPTSAIDLVSGISFGQTSTQFCA